MSGILLQRTWEVSSVLGADRVGRGRQSRHLAIDADEKSDTPTVPKKLPNKGDNSAEALEGRGVAKGSAGEAPTHRTPRRDHVSMGLEGVREAARRDRRAPLPSVKLAHLFFPSPTNRAYTRRKHQHPGVVERDEHRTHPPVPAWHLTGQCCRQTLSAASHIGSKVAVDSPFRLASVRLSRARCASWARSRT